MTSEPREPRRELEWWQASWEAMGNGEISTWYAHDSRWRINRHADGTFFLQPVDEIFSPKHYDDPFVAAKELANRLQRVLDGEPREPDAPEPKIEERFFPCPYCGSTGEEHQDGCASMYLPEHVHEALPQTEEGVNPTCKICGNEVSGASLKGTP